MDKLTEEQEKVLIEHCNTNNIKPNICAWYVDKDDFMDDWVKTIGYPIEDAEMLLLNNLDNDGEFLTFSDGQIIRLVK